LRERGIALLVIDHKIDFISQLCDRVAVLELGHKVAEGDPTTIWEDEHVIAAYLGVADDDEQWELPPLGSTPSSSPSSSSDPSDPSSSSSTASSSEAAAAQVPGREG
jgi:ABC-type glutathione transport system ATPase component